MTITPLELTQEQRLDVAVAEMDRLRILSSRREAIKRAVSLGCVYALPRSDWRGALHRWFAETEPSSSTSGLRNVMHEALDAAYDDQYLRLELARDELAKFGWPGRERESDVMGVARIGWRAGLSYWQWIDDVVAWVVRASGGQDCVPPQERVREIAFEVWKAPEPRVEPPTVDPLSPEGARAFVREQLKTDVADGSVRIELLEVVALFEIADVLRELVNKLPAPPASDEPFALPEDLAKNWYAEGPMHWFRRDGLTTYVVAKGTDPESWGACCRNLWLGEYGDLVGAMRAVEKALVRP